MRLAQKKVWQNANVTYRKKPSRYINQGNLPDHYELSSTGITLLQEPVR